MEKSLYFYLKKKKMNTYLQNDHLKKKKMNTYLINWNLKMKENDYLKQEKKKIPRDLVEIKYLKLNPTLLKILN